MSLKYKTEIRPQISLTAHLKSILLCTTAIVLSSCAAAQKPPVPGVRNPVTRIDPHPVAVSTVITALKCQMAKAFIEIKNSTSNRQRDRFPLLAGKGSFSGKTQVATNNSGKVTAVFPFTMIMGTMVKPKAGVTLSATGADDTKISFSYDPKMEPDATICTKITSNKSDTGSIVKDRIITAFEEITKIPVRHTGPAYNKNDRYYPPLGFTSIDLTTSFVVVQKIEAGAETTIIFAPPPDAESATPDFSADSARTRTYTLTLNMPFEANNTGSDKRLIVCEENEVLHQLCVDKPYTKKEYDARSDTKSDPEALIRFDDAYSPDEF